MQRFLVFASLLEVVRGVRTDLEELEQLETAAELVSFADMNESESIPIKTAVTNALLRGCVDEVGVKFAQLTSKQGLEDEDRAQNLGEAITKVWVAADKVLYKSTRKTRRAERDARNEVKTFGFNVDQAEKSCLSSIKKPYKELVEECVQSVSAKNETRRGGWKGWWWYKGQKVEALEPAPGNITDLLAQRFRVSVDYDTVKKFSTFRYSWRRDVRSLRGTMKDGLETVDDQIKAFGFRLGHTQEYCLRINENKTLSKDDWFIQRVVHELDSPARRIAGECQELPQAKCPEGTSPQVVRRFQTERATQVFTIFVASFNVGFPALIALGYAIGGPDLALRVTLITSIPGSGVLPGLPIGGIAGIPFRGDCVCAVSECEYSETHNACAMRNATPTKNEYSWLPYPGMKCVAPEGTSTAEKKCELTSCRAEDFAAQFSNDKDLVEDAFNGKLGVSHGGSYNCLSSNGQRHGQVSLMKTLPDVAGRGDDLDVASMALENTPANRAKMYKVFLK